MIERLAGHVDVQLRAARMMRRRQLDVRELRNRRIAEPREVPFNLQSARTYREIGLDGSLVQSSHDPTYTRAGIPAARAAK